jgi:hypothetical protein
MIESALISLVLGSTCAPIEAKRTYLYQFYPEQANLCYRVGGAIIGGSDIDRGVRLIEQNIEHNVSSAIRSTVPPYLYGPILYGGDVLLRKRMVIPIFRNDTFIWFGEQSGGLILNFTF